MTSSSTKEGLDWTSTFLPCFPDSCWACTTLWIHPPRPRPAACLRTWSPSRYSTTLDGPLRWSSSPTWSSSPANVAERDTQRTGCIGLHRPNPWAITFFIFVVVKDSELWRKPTLWLHGCALFGTYSGEELLKNGDSFRASSFYQLYIF